MRSKSSGAIYSPDNRLKALVENEVVGLLLGWYIDRKEAFRASNYPLKYRSESL
jgi:hypothetical protein